MSKLRFVGLDVHKDSLAVAGSAPAVILKRILSAPARVLAELRKLGPDRSLQVCL